MSGNQMIHQEESQPGGNEERGTVMMTVGKLLLWTDLIFLAFVYSSIKVGSHVYPIWFLTQAAIGGTLLGVGYSRRGKLTH